MNVREGDLAEVLYAITTPELSGRYVIVIRPAKEGEIFSDKAIFRPGKVGPCWVCQSPGTKLPWRLSDGNLYWFGGRPIADKYLRPIRPGEQPEETEVIEEVSA